MRKAKYRIGRVTVEGFRGFTKPQTVEIECNNIFIFGPNGRGKSSIIEAIRWCLFGSPSGRDIEVRNTFYEHGDCRVSMVLDGEDGQLEIHREIRPGHIRSRQTIRDSSGKQVLERDALPQLARIGHQEGTQVIFAAQQALGRQAQVDISDFTRVLCYYLHLEDVPSLLERLAELIEERSKEADELAGSIESAEAAYRDKIGSVRGRLEELLGNPPWGDGPSPTGAQTDNRIADFVNQLGQGLGHTPPKDAKSEQLLFQAKKWVADAEAPKAGMLDSQAEELRTKLASCKGLIERLDAQQASLAAAQGKCAELRANVGSLLDGKTVESLREQLRQEENALSNKDSRAQIARVAAKLCGGTAATECPLCERPIEAETLQAALTRQIGRSSATEEELESVGELRNTLANLEELDAKIAAQKREADEYAREFGVLKGEAEVLLECQSGGNPRAELQELAENLQSRLTGLQTGIEALAAERDKRNKRIKDLEGELRFHKYRDKQETLEWNLSSGLEEARDNLKEYRELLSATSEVRRLVQEGLRAALHKALPRLNELMTAVYQRLTQQASYDLVGIYQDPDKPERLELRVASSRLGGDQLFPLNVLNGQAAKAIQLVPYFVFSRFQPDVMELDLLLIDDPSESFDTSHVGSLVQELASAAEHAQLLVATHEREKFEPCLKDRFCDIPLGVFYVENFDPLEGPEVVSGS